MVGTISHKKIASLGGRATLKKYGPGYFSDIGKNGVKAKFAGMTKQERKEYFKRLSTAGVLARKAKKELQNTAKTT